MSDNTLPTAGLGTGTTLTTVLTGILTSAIGLVPLEYRETFKGSIPFLCPIVAWVVLWLYNRFVEPPALAKYRGKLAGDLKSLKKIRKDSTLTPAQKQSFDDDYFETQKLIARMGRDYNDGKILDSGS